MNLNRTQFLVSFEDLQQHMDSFNVESFDHRQTFLPPSLGQYIDRLASVYEMVEPVLTVVGALPILPGSWRRALALLTETIETILSLAVETSVEAEQDLEEVEEDELGDEELEEFKAGRDLEE